MRRNLVLTGVVLFFLAWGRTQAQALDITQMISGSAIQISPHSIRILDDLNGNKTQFEINSNTVYNNVQKLTDIKTGDKVQVEYRAQRNKNTAIAITKMDIEQANNPGG